MVPSCWNNELGLYNYRGAAWFRTYVHTVQELTHLRIICHGIMHHADVYLNGTHLGCHFGGFTPFNFTVPNLAKGRHELIIRVDNTVDWQTLPTDIADWFSYGGIYRAVEVQELSEVYIDHMKIQYTLSGSDARVRIDVGLASLSHEEKEISFTVHSEDLRSERGYFRDRARSFNNKGLVNEYRKPKLAYRKVREIYRGSRD